MIIENIENLTEEEKENLFYCEGSGDYYDSEEDGEDVDGYWYSYDYLEANCGQCEDCGRWLVDEYDIYYIENYGSICGGCYNNGNYGRCDGCYNYYHCDDLHYSDDGCDCYCDNCYEDEETDDDGVFGYHDFNNWIFYKTQKEDANKCFYIGVELEIEPKNSNYVNAQKVVNIMKKYDLHAVPMHDGSLNYGGVEMVFHPQTFKYWLTQKDKLTKAFNELIDIGYVSHNANNCGLHFHVTRPKNDDDFLSRAWLVMGTYYNEILKLSRRKEGEVEHWASFLNNNTKKINALSSDYIKQHKDGTRYKAINNTNSKTIEFRFFKGTLKIETFFSDLQFIYNLTKLCKQKNIDLCKINWQNLTKGEYIQKYVNDNNIQSNKIVKDYKLTIATIENKKELINNKIIKIVNDIMTQKIKNTNVTIDIENFDNTIYNIDKVKNILYRFRDYKYYVNDDKKRIYSSYLDDFMVFVDNIDFTTKINKLINKFNKIELMEVV